MSAMNGAEVIITKSENEKVGQLPDGPETANHNEDNSMPSPQDEEKAVRKKYGGLLPKKPPLISKDHERAFFDSADWALGKQGGSKPKGPLEALRPKLQPTPHQQARSRRSVYASSDNDNDDAGDAAAEDTNSIP